MKEYIKKFADASATNNYAIADIPFMTSVATNPVLNLVCNESGKKLVNTAGVVSIADAAVVLSFVLNSNDEYNLGSQVTIYYEECMTWGEWVNSKYNTFGFINSSGELLISNDFRLYEDNTADIANHVIDPTNHTYLYDWD